MNIIYKKYKDNGISISYFIIGKGQTILFLHGGGVDILAYKELMMTLAKKYQVIGVDIPCFGNSGVPDTLWSLSDYGEYFRKFLQIVSTNKVTVIGHSLGAGIGVYLASSNEKVNNLVLVDSAGLGKSINLLSFYYTFFIIKTLNGIFKYGQLGKFILLGERFLLNVVRHPFQQLKVFQIMNNALSKQDLPTNKIKANTLILWGNKDEIFPLSDAEEFHKQIHNSKLKIVDGNHDWCLFYPMKFNSLIEDFLS